MELLGVLLYIAAVLLCLWIFLMVIFWTLVASLACGAVVGIYKGIANYVTSLIQEVKLRK